MIKVVAQQKFILTQEEAEMGSNSEELASVIIQRLGLMPRKKGSTDKMFKVLIELYERAKTANQTKDPTKAVVTVEEMGFYAGITRQTMYDYLKRWLDLDLIVKTTYIDQQNNVVIGYKLNGPTLEQAYDKAKTKLINNLDLTGKYVKELQRIIKNEKIAKKKE